MQPVDLVILYEQGPCLVVCKPPGLATQAPAGIDSLEARIKAFLKERDRLPGAVYLGIPHRLDRPSSGAIVFGKNTRAARRLARQFERRQVGKTYWALVEGRILPESGTWEDFLRKVPDQPRAEVVPVGHPEGRKAVLHYRVFAAAGARTWLEIELQTGRMHQIRVQAAARGHPLLGDALYGSGVPFGPPHDDPRLRAIALHARTLTFQDPFSKERVAITAPLPGFWPPP